MSTIIVGERFNMKAWRPAVVQETDFRLLVRMGCLNRGSSRQRLASTGLKWDAGCNLLMPSPVSGEWDADRAREVATAIAPSLAKYDHVVLLGKRVCEAFGVDYVPGSDRGKMVVFPHPSGRCRFWNDPARVAKLSEVARRLSVNVGTDEHLQGMGANV